MQMNVGRIFEYVHAEISKLECSTIVGRKNIQATGRNQLNRNFACIGKIFSQNFQFFCHVIIII